MGIYECLWVPWVFMGIYGSMDVYGYLRVSMNIYGILWVFMGVMGINRCLWVPMDVYGYL